VSVNPDRVGGIGLLPGDLDGVEGTFLDYDGGIYWYMEYNNGARMWNEASNGTEYYDGVRYYFTPMISTVGWKTIVITYDGNKTDTFQVYASDVRDMPRIPAFNTYTELVIDDKSKSKKKIKATEQEVTVANIVAREVVNSMKPEEGAGLVIQWPEPDSALFGGMQLRVYIGYGTYIPGEPESMKFLFLDAPAQTGTVVIPANTWQMFKADAIGSFAPDVEIMLMYRVTGDHYMNRGHSSLVYFPIQ